MVVRPKSPCDALIPQFYAGRAIFITGATGFMGKVLIERILSTCPNVGPLYLLVRQKKGVSPEKRLQELKQSQVFDVVRQNHPSQLDKLCILPGDVCKPGFGLSPESLDKLREVSIVFHSAATVKFDEPLASAVEQNVLSVVRLMDICDTLPKLEALIHVSTAYSNPERQLVEERVYTAHTPLPKLLSLIESLPQPLLSSVTSQYIHPKPNTYTFTKAMAEEAVNARTNRHYCVAIFRPSIVICAKQHPFPGWIENLNGPSGVVVAAGKGILHVFQRTRGARADLIPVDMAIDTMLAIGWETALDKLPEVRVYNCSTYKNPTTWVEFEESLRKYLPVHPMDDAVWYPCGSGVENKYLYMILVFLLQTIPLTMAEYILRALGAKMKLNLVVADQKIRNMSAVLGFFSCREWHFKTDNVTKLQARLTPNDTAIYNIDPKTIIWKELYINFIKGTRKYLLKEKDENIKQAKRHMNRMYYLHKGVAMFVIAAAFRFLLQNRYVRDFAYGMTRMLFFFVFTVFSKVVEV